MRVSLEEFGFDHANKHSLYAGLAYKAVPRFGEFRSCCCLALLPQLACHILAIQELPYSEALFKPTWCMRGEVPLRFSISDRLL